MALLDVLRSGVKIVNNVTKSVQPTVSFQHCTGTTSYGPTYDDPVDLMVIVEQKEQQVKDMRSGLLVASHATVTFLDADALAKAVAPDLRVKSTDLVTLSDGTGGTIVSVGGFPDAGTGGLLNTTVYLG